jgi:hypothetical protein
LDTKRWFHLFDRARVRSVAGAAGGQFRKIFAEFKAAVARNDAQSVAELTQLPFLFDSKSRDSAGFQKIFPQLFNAKVRACFATAKAVIEQDAHVVNCVRYIFYFRDVNGRYRLIEFAADPEATP